MVSNRERPVCPSSAGVRPSWTASPATGDDLGAAPGTARFASSAPGRRPAHAGAALADHRPPARGAVGPAAGDLLRPRPALLRRHPAALPSGGGRGAEVPRLQPGALLLAEQLIGGLGVLLLERGEEDAGR